jgi:hypothetical protein
MDGGSKKAFIRGVGSSPSRFEIHTNLIVNSAKLGPVRLGVTRDNYLTLAYIIPDFLVWSFFKVGGEWRCVQVLE